MKDKSVIVTKIWSDMFGEKNTKDEDNFFELGGDSIMALKMSEQLKQKGYTISLMEVFDDPTLGGVLEAVKPLNPVAKTSALMENRNVLILQQSSRSGFSVRSQGKEMHGVNM